MKNKADIKRIMSKATAGLEKEIIYPEKVYWSEGSLLLGRDDRYIIEVFSYDTYQHQPPVKEHFRETFDTKEQALEYAKRLNEGDFPKVYRQLSLYDETLEKPHYRIMWQVGY